MVSKALALLVGFATMLGLSILNAPAAQAGNFNDVVHASDDSGYTADIRIRCSDGRIRFLGVGEWSGPKCGAHVDKIMPEYNQMVVCENMLPPYQSRTYWQGNTWELPSWSTFKCYMQRPI